ncbi:MAG TPA: serine hydrolase domain-containing protein [Mucilaginibacter sp.]
MATACSGFGQSTALSGFVTAYAREHHFNGTILIQQKGRKVYEQSFGTANFQFGVPNTNDTQYRIASITKLFTVVLIMQLREKGKIDLDKTIRTYLPGYKGEGGDKVKIYNLLTATSGIESNEKQVNASDDPLMYAKPYTTDELLNLFCSGKLENPPGKVFNYNNGDYVILGKIIEAVCKMPYEEVLREKILVPLHLTHTGMFGMLKVIPRLADVYMVNDSTKVIERLPPIYTENYWAAGGLYSNADDLLQFANALYGYRLLKEGSVRLILQPYLSRYGFGIWVYDKTVGNKKVRIAERQGAIWGIRTRLIWLPEQDVTFILLSNVQTANIDALQAALIEKMVR